MRGACAAGRVGDGRLTCFASTAWVNSGEKATCVIETSSSTMLKRSARRVRFSRTSLDTYIIIRGAPRSAVSLEEVCANG